MNNNPHYQRAILLLQQNRLADAENELRQMLMQDPQNAAGHATLAVVLLEQLKLNDATHVAERAIVLDPEDSAGHYALALVLHKRNRYQEAQPVIEEAIRIDPFDARYFAVLGHIKLAQRNWSAALDAANRGLEIEPNHDDCVNLRGIAMVHLGDRAGASETIRGALERDPENAVTHANQGWALMHRNQPKQAMEHFRESLRIDPSSNWAKAGIVEAMKARNPLYRLLVIYFLFMARQGTRVQWAVIIGGYVGYRLLGSFQNNYPEFSIFVLPIMAAYIIFALSTWLAPTLMNLMLRFDRFGKYALSKEQIWTSNLVAILLVSAIAMFLGSLTMADDWLLTAALFTGVLALPASALFSCSAGWPRWAGAGVLLVLVFIGGLEVLQEWNDVRPGYVSPAFQYYIWGIIISQFVMQGLAAATVKE